MCQRKKILIVFTGGTIISAFNEKNNRVCPNKRIFNLLHDYIKNIFKNQNIELIFRKPLGIPGKDSSNINLGDWIKISKIIVEEFKKGLNGVLVLYGTDTMAYFSSWLSLCFPKINIPIIITGSQFTLDYKSEDVTTNLRGAAQVVCSGFSGVWIYCNWKLIRGDQAHKASASCPDMFIANNDQFVYFNRKLFLKRGKNDIFSKKEYVVSMEMNKILSYNLERVKSICKKIEWLMCVPGIKPKIEENKKIVCIYGFGSGNAPSTVLNYLHLFYLKKEKPCIIACSQAEKDIKKPEYYENVGIAGLSKKGFKVWSQLYYPIEFIHSLAFFSLLVSFDDPGYILSKYLESPY